MGLEEAASAQGGSARRGGGEALPGVAQDRCSGFLLLWFQYNRYHLIPVVLLRLNHVVVIQGLVGDA